jgi:hypothetical protein
VLAMSQLGRAELQKRLQKEMEDTSETRNTYQLHSAYQCQYFLFLNNQTYEIGEQEGKT